MIIDYSKIEEQQLQNFKGGNGELDTRNFIDEKNKIMMSRLKPGANSGYHKHEMNSEIVLANSGYHKHEMNSEIVYIISGEGHFKFDDTEEKFHTGDVHYCPMGHSHAMYNDGEEDLIYFAIVPEHH